MWQLQDSAGGYGLHTAELLWYVTDGQGGEYRTYRHKSVVGVNAVGRSTEGLKKRLRIVSSLSWGMASRFTS